MRAKLLLRLLIATIFIAGLPLHAAPALAESAKPGWEVTATTYPTVLPPNGEGHVELDVYNIGAEGSSGPVTVTDTLPPGLIATEAGDIQAGTFETIGKYRLWNCGGIGTNVVTCTNSETRLPSLPIKTPRSSGVSAGETEEEESQYGGVFVTDDNKGTIADLGIAVQVEPGTPERHPTSSSCEIEPAFCNHVTVAGGGAPMPANISSPLQIGSQLSKFGFEGFDGWFSDADGTIDTQAGSHPYEAVFSFDLDTEAIGGSGSEFRVADGQARNIVVNLPPGLVGNPTAVPRCTQEAFSTEECPASTQVGFDVATAGLGSEAGLDFPPFHLTISVFNLVPPPGVPAQFGLALKGHPVLLDAGVRSGGDYGISEHTDATPQVYVMGNRIVLWGEPANPAHDAERFISVHSSCGYGGCASNAARVPFLTLPTACEPVGQHSEDAPEFTIASNTWETDGFAETTFLSHDANDVPTGFSGCDHLGFNPSISVKPETREADTPSGLTVEVRAPQEGLLNSEGLATSNIKDTTVVLPAGMAINPGQAAGLQSCPEGPASTEPGHERYGDNLPLAGENGEEQRFEGPANCPGASQVGTVKIETPLLFKPLEGSVYVMRSEPPDLKLLMAASGEGVNLKLIGTVHLCESAGETIETGQPGGSRTCEAPGQLITTFEKTPELPFTAFKLSFSGGARAALVTPSRCGEYMATSDFTPWAEPAVGDVFPSSGFAVSSGPGGSGCPGALPFSPSLTAGATTDQAGGFTNFSLLLTRGDDQQRIGRLSFTAPEGLTGFLSKVTLCTNAQAETNTCPEASKIGHTVVESGPGPYPLVVPEPGQPPAAIYLTEGYEGAPFGLSVVVPLKVGPFELPTQRVRARIEVNPITSQLTVTTDELPQQVAGVPTDLREVDAVIERPEFMVNPTNCSSQQFSGTAYGAPPPGQPEAPQMAAISSRFEVGSCQALKFEPKFSVSTSGKTSKSQGASLTVKVSYPNVPQGTDADISYVKVELPKALPSRLTTLQKACTARQFEANPAACPAESKIGYATVHTPLLPVPLSGPAIFVSHGGESFPSLTIVLQGDGVTIDLVGDTDIKGGVTSTTFKTVPDDPFSTFELTLPEGSYSALAANGNLCQQKLVMPTAFVAQNGATLNQNTHIEVEGCSSALTVVSKKIKGKTITVKIYVPGAGRVSIGGRGLHSRAKKISGRETVALSVSQKHAGRLRTHLRVVFTPSTGKLRKRQVKALTVQFAK
jgi:hypothetical protein